MLGRLRLRLTLLYVLAGLALMILVAGGAYRLLHDYFARTTDLALQYTMAREMVALGADPPPELRAAGSTWQAHQALSSSDGPAEPPEDREGGHAGDEDDGRSASVPGGVAGSAPGEEAYDGDLAAVYVVPLGADGTLLSDPNAYVPPFAPDRSAVTAALSGGYDWRTVTLAGGTRVRLLTYRLAPAGAGRPAALQAGRALADQDRLLASMLAGLLTLGVAGLALLAAGSWWLAGRSLVPAQRAWERQQAFVANASHELRTPLTLIRASAEVARRGLPETSDEACALLGDVLQECDHTGRLVDDLLLLSRLDAGHLACERRPVDLRELFADLQRQVGRVAETRGVQLAMAGDGTLVLGDPARLRQVLLILLDNALRHTPAGGTVQVDARAPAPARPWGERRQVCLQVSDTGDGIPAEHLPFVFERFYRVDEARGHGDGTGLGLAIAKALVKAQHGHIALVSRPGTGTRVTVTLPAA